jgi:hypothetical protein
MSAKNKVVRRPDPLIDEIRVIRQEIHDRAGGDIAKIAREANEFARKYRARARRVSAKRTTGKK